MNECVSPNTFIPPVSFNSMNLNTINNTNVNTLIQDAQKINSINATPPIFWNPSTLNISYNDPTPKIVIPDGVSYSDYLFWNNNENKYNSGREKVHIGSDAGKTGQGDYGIAIGYKACENLQGNNSVSIGRESGNNQGQNSVCLGYGCGQNNQGIESIAIGNQSGLSNQGNNSVGLGSQTAFIDQGNFCLAIGTFSGYVNQGEGSVAIGSNAGGENQGQYSTSIGLSAGQLNQGDSSVAIGFASGQNNQGNNSISIGFATAQNDQGNNCIAIGDFAGRNNQHNNTIVINSSGVDLDTINTNSLYIDPIRNDNDPLNNTITYNPSTKELVYNSTKTFVIQHPEYENKYLVHSCLEGPEAGVYYRGNDTTDDYDKEAKKFYKKIILPTYTKSFKDFSIQITPYCNNIFDDFPKISTTKIENGIFFVSSDKKCDFSWIVFGKRLDIITEVDKTNVILKGENTPYTWIEKK